MVDEHQYFHSANKLLPEFKQWKKTPCDPDYDQRRTDTFACTASHHRSCGRHTTSTLGKFCCTLELIELRLKMLIRWARFLIRNIHTENTYEPCFIRRPVRVRRPPIPPNLLFRAKKKVQLSGELDQKRKLVVALLDFSFRHLSPSQLE